MTVLGAVLAGGLSRRFGGDKALATIDGTTLIDRAIGAVAPWVDTTVVCGREHGGEPAVPDRPGAGLGPLGGLNGALWHARARGFAAVLTIACDMPVLPDGLARELLAGGARVVAGQPLLGCWPVDLAGRLDAHLAVSTDLSMRAWIAAAEAETIAADGRDLPNINTPADLTAYIAILAGGET